MAARRHCPAYGGSLLCVKPSRPEAFGRLAAARSGQGISPPAVHHWFRARTRSIIASNHFDGTYPRTSMISLGRSDTSQSHTAALLRQSCVAGCRSRCQGNSTCVSGAGSGNVLVTATATKGSSRTISCVLVNMMTGLFLGLPLGDGTRAWTSAPC